MRSIVVIPTYNEAASIGDLIDAVLAVLPGGHILVVDDASPDGTGEVVSSRSRQDGRVALLRRHAKLGLGTAYVAGFRRALAGPFELILQMDADLSHDPGQIKDLVAAAAAADVALGARYVAGGSVEGWGGGRLWLSRTGNLYARLCTGMRVSDATSGFKCYRRHVLEAIDLDRIRSNGYAFQVEILFAAHRQGFRIKEVPITFIDRRAGHSKMSLGIALEAAWRLPALRLARRPGWRRS